MGQIQHCVLIIPFSLVATSSWKVIISSTSRFFSQKGQSISPMSYSCCTVLIWPSSFWSPSCCQKQNRNFIVIHIKVIYKSLFKLWNPRQKESKQLQKPFQQIMDAFFSLDMPGLAPATLVKLGLTWQFQLLWQLRKLVIHSPKPHILIQNYNS